jgi:hypothetical protein
MSFQNTLLIPVSNSLSKAHVILRCPIFLSPFLFYLLVHRRCRGFLQFHLITLKHTSQLAALLWTRDQSVAEISTWQNKECTRQISMPPVGFETTIPASARPQTYALDRAATEIGYIVPKQSISNLWTCGRANMLSHLPDLRPALGPNTIIWFPPSN